MRKQVWSGSLACGLTGRELTATFKHVSTDSFKDDVGEVLVKLCHVVPNGLLVFFPSYATLSKLIERWHETGVVAKIEAAKTLV